MGNNMSDLSISLLGPFRMSLNGQPLTQFRTRSVQALLIYLVCEAERPHQREVLMDLFWPAMPLTSAQANMRQTPWACVKRQTNPSTTYYSIICAREPVC